MEFRNIETLKQRFDDSIYELAMAEMCERTQDEEKKVSHTRNAISAGYQALDWMLKHSIDIDYTGTDKTRLLKNGNLNSLLIGVETYKDLSSIDTTILKDTKRFHRNPAEHGGEKPSLINTKEAIEEVRKVFQLIMDSDIELKTIDSFGETLSISWDSFYSLCDKFTHEERNFILIIGDCQNVDEVYLENLSIPNWDLIIDLDYFSLSTGFYNKIFSTKIPQPNKINITELIDDEKFTKHKQAHYHYFINSYAGSGVEMPNDFDSWNRRYGSKLDRFFKEYAAEFSVQKTIVVILDDNRRYLNYLCNTFKKYFASKTEFVFALPQFHNLENVIEDAQGKKVEITISEIAQGIANFSSNFGVSNPYKDKYVVPFLERTITEGTTGILEPEFYAQLENDFEVLHKGLDTFEPEIKEEAREFLSGYRPISWLGLRNDWDRKHPSLKKRIKEVRDALSNAKGIVELVHEAGYGGTTIGRRIAWEFHNDYPTLILKDYRENRTVQKLIQLHNQTRKTILVVMDVPQSITLDDVDTFYNLASGGSGSRPIVFLVVRRGSSTEGNLTDWGNHVYDLLQSYKEFLNDFSDVKVVENKYKEFEDIKNGIEAYKKTPFYVGLVTFEEKFFAIKDYIKKFVEEIKTIEQRKVILYLVIVHDYLGERLPSSFFRTTLKLTNSKEVIRLEDYLPGTFNSILASTTDGNQRYWQPRHVLFSKALKEQILEGSSSMETDIWKTGLADVCIDFIKDSVVEGEGSRKVQEILQTLFIGTRKDRHGKTFTPIVEDIRIEEEKERLFKCLKESYPENSHYCSHLARFYAYYRRNRELAFKYANEAISLSEGEGRKDPLLYHIKGMCIREAAYDLMDSLMNKKRNEQPLRKEDIDEVINELVPNAEKEFELSRKISNDQNKTDEYGYVSHIQMLIRAIDFGAIISGQDKSDFLAENKYPYHLWIDMAETLLEEIRRITINKDDNQKIIRCEDELNLFYERYDLILQSLNSQLEKGENSTGVRRQIVRTYFRKKEVNSEGNSKVLNRILDLMEDNINEEPANEKNFYLWFKAARFSSVTLADALSKIGRWKAQSTSLDATYYFYILKVFSAIEGYTPDAIDAVKLIKECKNNVPKSKNITFQHEWYGKGNHLRRLKSHKEFDSINKESTLDLVRGYFTDFENMGSGFITIADKIKVFFSPAQAKLSQEDLNKEVEFYLGFSYDGPRADSSSVRLAIAKHQGKNISRAYEPISELVDNSVLDDIIIEEENLEPDRIRGVIISMKNPPRPVMGFIMAENEKKYFFHKKNEKAEIFKNLKVESKVSFVIRVNDRGEYATSIKLIKG